MNLISTKTSVAVFLDVLDGTSSVIKSPITEFLVFYSAFKAIKNISTIISPSCLENFHLIREITNEKKRAKILN